MGDHNEVGLVAQQEVTLLLPALERDVLSGEVVYRTPLEAPIEKGQQVAELVVTLKELPDAHIPLYADRDVARGGFLPRIRTAMTVLFQRYAGGVQDAN